MQFLFYSTMDFREYWLKASWRYVEKVPIFAPKYNVSYHRTVTRRMEKFRYILFSVFLSSLIIYMGVGVPIVQSRCYKCADNEVDGALLAVVEVSDEACACGCMNEGEDDQDGGSECACRRHKAERKADIPCSSVKIQKLNLPVLGASLHLDNLALPVIDLIFNTYNINFDLLSSVKEECIYADTSLHRQPPRGYLNLICTLLI